MKPADFHILLALVARPLHGYRIMKDVERDTGGEVRLEIGSLYRLLVQCALNGNEYLIDSVLTIGRDDSDARCSGRGVG